MRDNFGSGIVDVEARLNVAADGKRFHCDFIREGPVYFADKGVEVLRRETILANLQTFIGKPLTIEHIDPRMNVTDPAVFATVAHGRIDNVGFDKETGWFFCEGDVTTDQGRDAAGRMSPSCGYNVLGKGAGGRWNNLPYERELTAIEFHHLALTTKRPRYEEADFRLNAVTNPKGDIIMFKFLRKLVPAKAGDQPVTEEVEIPSDTTIKLANGKEVRLNAVIEAHTTAEEAAAKKKKDDDDAAAAAAAGADSRANAITDDTVVVVAGKQVLVKDLRAAYEARENAVAAEAAKGKADFKKLNEAAATGAVIRTDFPQTAGTLSEGLARGKY